MKIKILNEKSWDEVKITGDKPKDKILQGYHVMCCGCGGGGICCLTGAHGCK